ADLDVQIVPGDRAGGRRQLSRRAGWRTAARAGRAAGLAVPHHPALGGGRLRPAGCRPADPTVGVARRPPDMSARRPMVLVLIAVGLAALAAYPTVGTGYGVRAMLQLFMWIALASSWNLVSDLTGYVSFGHVAFFGIGSYATAIPITRAAWPWLPASLAGGVAAAVPALVIGCLCLLLSAVGPGSVGGLAARDQGYFEPISVFPLATTITMIVMVLFGGKGTVWGPVLGAAVLFVFQEAVWARFIYLHQLLFGAIIIA